MGKRLSIKIQSSFLDSLNSLLQNGFSIKEAMNLMGQLQTKQSFISDILDQLKAGKSFAQSIDGYFAPNMVNQIQIAEQHGQLRLTLKEVHQFILAQAKYQTKIKALLMYPLFLILLLMVIIIGINIFVTPQLTMMGSAHQNPTIFNWWWLPCSATLIGGGVIYLWYKQQSKLHQLELLARMPIVGKIIQNYYAYYLASNISLLLASGLEAKSIANLMKRFPVNSVFYGLGNELSSIVQTQGSIKQLIEKYGFIPNETVLFFDHGDSITEIAKKLNGYSKMAFDQMWTLSQRLIAIIQPLIFIIIGAIIVGTYLQMLLPMYDTLSEVYD